MNLNHIGCHSKLTVYGGLNMRTLDTIDCQSRHYWTPKYVGHTCWPLKNLIAEALAIALPTHGRHSKHFCLVIASLIVTHVSTYYLYFLCINTFCHRLFVSIRVIKRVLAVTFTLSASSRLNTLLNYGAIILHHEVLYMIVLQWTTMFFAYGLL